MSNAEKPKTLLDAIFPYIKFGSLLGLFPFTRNQNCERSVEWNTITFLYCLILHSVVIGSGLYTFLPSDSKWGLFIPDMNVTGQDNLRTKLSHVRVVISIWDLLMVFQGPILFLTCIVNWKSLFELLSKLSEIEMNQEDFKCAFKRNIMFCGKVMQMEV